MFKNYNNTINIFLICFTVAVIFIILSYFFSFSFVTNDDLYFTCNSFKDLFIKPHNSHYISSFFCKLFAVYLPMKLNIHPHFFKSSYFCYIESFFVILFSFITTNFFYLHKKINFYYIIYFLFSVSLVFYFLKEQLFLLLFVYEGFFRILMPAFLFLLLFYILLNQFDNNYKRFFVYLLVFLCGISNEMICISVFLGFLFYFISSRKEINNKQFINYIVIIALSFIIFLKSGGFIRHSDTSMFNLQYFINVIKYIPEFCKDYFKYVIINHLFLHLLLIFQMLILIFDKHSNSPNKIKTIKLIICFNLGILIFFFLLIGLGKTHYNYGQFWVVHKDLHVMYNIILSCFNITLFNLITRFKIINEKIINILFLIITVFFVSNIYCSYKNTLNKFIKPILESAYKTEKIIALANIKNKTAYINDDSYKVVWGYYCEPNEKEHNKLYNFSPYIMYINQFDFIKKINVNYMFTDEETVNKEFKANGGVFTDDELNNINFNNLKNEKFIINKK